MSFNFQSNVGISMQEAITSMITNISQNVASSANLNCNSSNFLNVQTGQGANGQSCNFEVNGNFTVDQNAKANCNLTQTVTSSLVSQIANQIQSGFTALANQSGSSTQEFLALAASLQSNYQNDTQRIISDISNYIAQNVSTVCSSVVNAQNSGYLNFCGYFRGNVNITQSSAVSALSSCVIQTYGNAIANNASLNTLFKQTDQQLVSEQNGPLSWLTWIVFAVIIVAIIGLLTAVIGGYFGQKKGGKRPAVKK